MDAATVVRLVIIGFEITLAMILVGFMCRALDMHPIRAMLRGVEVIAFTALAILPAPRTPGRHRVCAS